jgi:plasmid stabilization system protein ParE
MPRKRKITLAGSALSDLEEILTWYADQQIPAVGESLLKEIMAEVERLADFPESGRVVPEFGIADLREVVHAPFRIVYRLGRNRVRIVRVWRGERVLEMP